MAAKTDFGPRIGADPELFLTTKEGQIIPACGLIGGTKDNPTDVTKQVTDNFGMGGWYRGCKGIFGIQEDNVMLEFNVPAFQSHDSFTRGINYILATLEQNILPAKRADLMIKYGVTSFKFKPEVLALYPQALEIGCMPDNNAYADPANGFERAPYTALDFGSSRFCGGHIHVQYNKENVPPHIFAQFMDVVACLPFLSWDKQKERRQFYGQPGLYRNKDYGIEYRTLSSFWLKPDFRERRLYAMAENVLQLAAMANKSDNVLKAAYKRIPWGEVQKIIREEDFKGAEELTQHLMNTLPIYINRGG